MKIIRIILGALLCLCLAFATLAPAYAANGLEAQPEGANGLVVQPTANGLSAQPNAQRAPLNAAVIKLASNAAVSRIGVCRRAASSTACAYTSQRTMISRGHSTANIWSDTDGFFVGQGYTAYIGGLSWRGHGHGMDPQHGWARFVKVSGCAGCTWTVQIRRTG